MVEMRKKKRLGVGFISLIAMISTIFFAMTAMAAEEDPIKISYYYEEVCASCDGTKDFFDLYNRVISSDEKKTFAAEISTYNVFMESCKKQYEEVKTELEIPSGTSLPVLVIEDQWISGLEHIEDQLHDVLLSKAAEQRNPGKATEAVDETQTAAEETEKSPVVTVEEKEESAFWTEIRSEIENAEKPVILMFSTNGCEDCNAVKAWFEENSSSLNCEILEYNIIEKECLEELKAIFTQYQVPEENQKVPAVFFGDTYLIGKEEIPTIANTMLEKDPENKMLLNMLESASGGHMENAAESMNLWTLAVAGLLAGFNPCSISMLLMLLSLLLSEKASIWKSGLLYLIGKYAAYLSIGLVIFMTASQISNQTMEQVGGMMQTIMGILFAVAAVFYIIDAIRIHNQDYGNIKTQLPVGLRRMNHNLIKKVSSAGGIMQPLMILMLGIVISFGEFFCTGQIYMASITYLLKDQVKAAVLPFLVYTTAMSVPAVIMILLIQRTRNTDAVSDFMFRHLGMIKVFNAILFILFALYFLVF